VYILSAVYVKWCVTRIYVNTRADIQTEVGELCALHIGGFVGRQIGPLKKLLANKAHTQRIIEKIATVNADLLDLLVGKQNFCRICQSTLSAYISTSVISALDVWRL